MASTTTPARGAAGPTLAPSSQSPAAIGVGIDTARYGHLVSFLRPDRQAVAKKLLVMENHASYQALRERLEQLHQQHPQTHFHIRIDAAGQYANNLERFLRGLTLPITLSIGEPKRNRDYQKAHFPKRQTDETESIAMAPLRRRRSARRHQRRARGAGRAMSRCASGRKATTPGPAAPTRW